MTGGRLKRLRPSSGNAPFMCTYGDGLASIDIDALVRSHRRSGRFATLTAASRFGGLERDGDRAKSFVEKPSRRVKVGSMRLFVFEPAVPNRIDGDATWLEQEPLAELAADSQLTVYRHEGFWQPMDTLRDKRLLEELWAHGNAPWVKAPVCHGHQKAIVAVAHSILVVVYHILERDEPYKELGADYFIERQRKDAYQQRLVKQLERMGYEVALTKQTA